jgi:methyl-accepting chemotaxis protein
MGLTPLQKTPAAPMQVRSKVVKFATVIIDQVNQEQAVAEAANMAYSTSLQTDNSAQRGTTVVTQAVAVMRDLAKHMQQAGEGIEALNAQSQLIGSIVKTLSGIAEQTNLLALNAAIEAARAGEQGRGPLDPGRRAKGGQCGGAVRQPTVELSLGLRVS